ncbi:MAG TPA: ferritin-like domain-containing protein [Chthonomonadaceae bacterium]|nr:ferritin-like domain-containing protein [Chthonomonadaceae bacterium]
MQIQSLQDLFVDELRDLYSAETQILKALPKMAEKAVSEELKNAFQQHLQQTQQHVQRLDQIFQSLQLDPKGKACKGMRGLLEEGDEFLNEGVDRNVIDAGLISMAQRVEHYEIAGYGSVRTYAQQLGDNWAADLLQQTLDEEGQTDKKLTMLAEQRGINQQAQQTSGVTA